MNDAGVQRTRWAQVRAVARLARRTARREWRRTTLVAALVAVPVMAGIVVAGIVRANELTATESVVSRMGTADVTVALHSSAAFRLGFDDPDVATMGRLVEEVEADHTVAYHEHADFPNANHPLLRSAAVTDLPLDDPVTEDMFAVLEGRAPRADDEIAVSEPLLDRHDLAVGDTVDFGRVGTATVVGEVVDPTHVRTPTVVVRPALLDRLVDTYAGHGVPRWLVAGVASPRTVMRELSSGYDEATGLADAQGRSQQGRLDGHVGGAAMATPAPTGPMPAYPDISTRADQLRAANLRTTADRVMTPQVIATLVTAVLLAEVALIAGAAYATGARRRLRELGLLGANGATTGHVRAAVVGEATVTGMVGGIVGVAAGVAALGFSRPVLQRFVNPLITRLELSATDLVGPAVVAVGAVSVAAWLPARTAARVPTTTALEGRMPLSAPRRWVVPVGIGLAGFGALLLTVGILASGPLGGTMAAVGVLLAIGGTALLTVPVIAGIGRLADRFPATLRLVLRDSGRQRTRAAAASASAMVVLIAPVLIATFSMSMQQQALVRGLPAPDDQVLLGPAEAQQARFGSPAYDGPEPESVDRTATVEAIAAILPDADRADVEYLDARATVAADPRFDVDPPHTPADDPIVTGPQPPNPEAEFWTSYGGRQTHVATATAGLLDVLELPAATQAIADDQLVVLGLADRETTVTLDGQQLPALEVPARVLQGRFPRVLVPPERVAPLGLDVAGTGDLFVTADPITEAQRRTLYETVNIGEISIGQVGPGNGAWVRWAAIGATLLVALVILALVTMLSATESDHDLRTMVAVGAAPRMRRRFLGLQSGVHALVGAVLAVPLAIALAWAASRAEADYLNQGAFGAVPAQAMWLDWTAIGVVLVGVPAVIGVVIALLVRSAPTVPPRRLG